MADDARPERSRMGGNLRKYSNLMLTRLSPRDTAISTIYKKPKTPHSVRALSLECLSESRLVGAKNLARTITPVFTDPCIFIPCCCISQSTRTK
jgi:hypothetical protein